MSSFLHLSNTRIIHLRRFIFALQELHKGVYNAPSGHLCYTDLVDNAGNRDSRRLHMCRGWKRDRFSPRKGVASCVPMVIDWDPLLCSRTVLAVRWFNVGVFSPGWLQSFKM